MMRLPARLAAKLTKVRIAQILSSEPANSLLHCVDPEDVLHCGSSLPVSREKMESLIDNPAPVIWIGGNEALHHPGMGHFVRAIAQSGHYVFLETDGTLLRRRIHEFQPQQQLFLTVRLNSLRAAESSFAVEGLRAARLSGFFTVVHSIVREDSEIAQLPSFRSFLLDVDVDGWLITAASPDEAVVRKAAEARRLIPSSFWRQFSVHVEKALLSQAQGGELHNAQAVVPESLHTEAGQESVRIA